MTSAEILKYLQEEIHTTVAASADREGLPVTCAIDIMDADEEGIYFLTAKGKGFYQRLKANGYIAMTGMKGKDTMSCTGSIGPRQSQRAGRRTAAGPAVQFARSMR